MAKIQISPSIGLMNGVDPVANDITVTGAIFNLENGLNVTGSLVAKSFDGTSYVTVTNPVNKGDDVYFDLVLNNNTGATVTVTTVTLTLPGAGISQVVADYGLIEKNDPLTDADTPAENSNITVNADTVTFPVIITDLADGSSVYIRFKVKIAA